MKVYVVYDPCLEKNMAVYTNEEKAWDECEKLNKVHERMHCYFFEAQEFDLIED